MSKKITNKIMLITYADCMGDNLKDLKGVLEKYYEGAIEGLHVLPFFPSSGDRGFAPLTYDEVEPAFGDWDDIRALSNRYYMMCDYMINHMSAHSPIYQDFLEKHEESKYKDFFIHWNKFWDGEPSPEDDAKLYKRRQIPWVWAEFKDGTREKVWCTFSPEQIDIDCLHSEEAKAYLRKSLKSLADRGMALIRTDAMAYAAKRKGTSCFFVEPEMSLLLNECKEALSGTGTEILPEIHEHYFFQQRLQEHGAWTYDFQLPFLVLNAVLFGNTRYLKNWLKIAPKHQFTTLDTHDGIGIIDARYTLPDEEIIGTQKKLYELYPDLQRIMEEKVGKITFSIFDTYQMSGTYFELLGGEEECYLMARAVQFFTPGIPQVYYVGLFAGENDYEFYRKSGAAKDLNRKYYSLSEIEEEEKRPVVQKMTRLMRFRNIHPSFDGEITVLDTDTAHLCVRWENGTEYAVLNADFANKTFEIRYSENGQEKVFE